MLEIARRRKGLRCASKRLFLVAVGDGWALGFVYILLRVIYSHACICERDCIPIGILLADLVLRV